MNNNLDNNNSNVDNVNTFVQGNNTVPNSNVENNSLESNLGNTPVSENVGIENVNTTPTSNVGITPQNSINSAPLENNIPAPQNMNNSEVNSGVTNPGVNNGVIQNANSNIQSPTTNQSTVSNSSTIAPNMNVAPVNAYATNTVPNQNIAAQPVNSSTKKAGNKKLMTILIIVSIIAVISIIVAVVVVNNNKSKTVNDYEPTPENDISQTSDTIDFNGFTVTKKAGYDYELDDDVLLIKNTTSLYQAKIYPYSFSTIEVSKDSIKTNLTNNGYNPTNMKISEYSGKKALSFELSYKGMQFLYFIYQLPFGNYSIEFYVRNATSTIDYNLITESMNLSNGITKSTTFAPTEEKEEVEISKINSELIDQ